MKLVIGVLCLAALAALACGTSPAYEKAYQQETQRLEAEAAAQRAEAGRYAAVVYFDVGSSTIKEEGYEELDWFVQKVSVDPTAVIHVRGFADSTGGDAVNQKLSYERAENVARYLVSKGIPQARLAPLGFSSEFAVKDNTTAEGRKSNRRVEVTVR